MIAQEKLMIQFINDEFINNNVENRFKLNSMWFLIKLD